MHQKKKKENRTPKFSSDEEAARFWDTHSIDRFWDQLEPVKETVFVKPEKQVISIRLDRKTVRRLKAIASRMGIGYSQLTRLWVLEKLNQFPQTKAS